MSYLADPRETDLDEMAGLADLGFSLKPPKWLRNLGAKLISQTHVAVPTPAGPKTFDLSNPDHLAELKSLVTGTHVTLGPTPPTMVDQFESAGANVGKVVESIPGGWITIAAVGIGLLLIVPRLMPRARGR
jgi:hypothetical protein